MNTKFIALLCFSLTASAWACEPGSRCIGDRNQPTQLDKCGDLKQLPKIKEAAESSQEAMGLLQSATRKVSDYKATCAGLPTQDNDKIMDIYRQGDSAGATAGEARLAHDRADKLINQISGPIEKLGLSTCKKAVALTKMRLEAEKSNLDGAAKGMETCAAIGGGAPPIATSTGISNGTTLPVGPDGRVNIHPNSPFAHPRSLAPSN